MKIIIYRISYVLLSLVLSSCGTTDYYLLTTEVTVGKQKELGLPEVTATDEYRKLASGTLMIAVQAPNKCAGTSAGQFRGDADPTASIIKTDCGVEMAEVERSLSKSGYTSLVRLTDSVSPTASDVELSLQSSLPRT